MRLEEIHLKNFGPFHDCTLRLSAVSAAVVLGQNGAGKSILFIDAVRAALFGRARSPMDDMIRTGATDMMVGVVFRLGDHRYRVIRKRSLKTKAGKTELSLQMQGPGSIDWNDISGARVADTQDKIHQLLTADDELLTSTAFFVQGQADRFSRATPGERKTILAAILRLDHYATMRQEAARLATRAEDQIADRTDRINDLDALEQDLERLTNEHRATEEDNKREADRSSRLEQGRDALVAKLSDLRAQLNQRETLATHLGRNITLLESTKTREQTLQMRHATLVDQAKGSEAIAIAQREMDQLQILQREVEGSRQAILERQRELEAERIRRDARAQELLQVGEQIESHRTRLDGLLAKHTRLAKILDQRPAIEQAGQQAETLKADIADVESEIERSHVMERTADQHAAEATAKITERGRLQNILNPLRVKMAEAAHEYRQNTKALGDTLEQTKKAVGLLKEVPCDAGLQARCQFTIDAVEARTRIPLIEATLANRLTAQDQIYREVMGDEFTTAIKTAGLIEQIDNEKPEEALQVAHQRKRNMQAARGELIKERDRRKAALVATEALTALAGELKMAAQESEAIAPEIVAEREELEHLAARLELLKPDPDADRGLAFELAQIPQTLAGLQRNSDERQARITDLTAKIARTTEQVETATRDLPGVMNDLAKCIEERNKLDAVVKAQKVELEAADHAAQEFDRTQDLLTSTADQIASSQETLRAILVRLGTLSNQIAATTRQIDEGKTIREQIAGLRTDARQYRVLEEAYAIIPTLVMENAIPALEQETNHLLDRISRTGMRIRIDTQKALKSKDGLAETLDITVRDQVGERPIDNYSGGERFRLDLSMRVALSKLLARRAGAKIQTLAIDEGLGSLDEDGLEQLRECLGAIGNDFDLILVITHVDSMKSTFPSQIFVSKDAERGSRVEVLQ